MFRSKKTWFVLAILTVSLLAVPSAHARLESPVPDDSYDDGLPGDFPDTVTEGEFEVPNDGVQRDVDVSHQHDWAKTIVLRLQMFLEYLGISRE